MKKIIASLVLILSLSLPSSAAISGDSITLPGMKRDNAVSNDAPVVASSLDIDDKDFIITDNELQTKSDLIKAIDSLPEHDRLALAEIVGEESATGKAIYDRLGVDYSNAATALWAKFIGRDLTYRDIVQAVAKKMDIGGVNDKTIAHLEMEIVASQTIAVYEKMPEDEKKLVSIRIKESLEKSGAWDLLDEKTREAIENENIASGLIILLSPGFISGVTANMIKNLLTTANTEMAAVVGISAAAAAVLTGGVGSTLSLLTGPVGWAAVGSYFAWRYLDTDYKTLTNFVTAFAMMRR